MVSDDTEHLVFVAQSLLAHPRSPDRFGARLGWCLRLWLLSVPAGIGLGTLRAILRLWMFRGPSRSGVRSAGNGPAMRSAIAGAVLRNRPDDLEQVVSVSTRITHTDPRALTGARVVAYSAAWALRDSLAERPPLCAFLAILRSAGSEDCQWVSLVDEIGAAARDCVPVAEFADRLGLARGVSGYAYHTVPVVAYAWYLHFGDFRDALEAVLNCGGDTDTTGSIIGALTGAVVGEQGIPAEWVDGIWEWPRTTHVLREIADRLTEADAGTDASAPVPYFWPGLVPRGLLFLMVVLAHGFRRLLPPY